MKTEVSSGGVIVRQTPQGPEVLVMKDMNGNWTFPKGIIDPGENPEQTAKREIQEEVGLSALELVSPLQTVSYWYVRNAEKIHKTVHYFLFTYTGDETPKPQTEEGISEIRFVPFHEAHAMIGYPKTNDPLLTEATQKLNTL